MALGLYIHVPFCTAICNYCNFNRGVFDAAVKARYVTALLTEIQGAADLAEADTIFFGGGTPSLLEPSEVAAVIQTCRRSFTMPASPEITLEANPETVTVARLEAFRAAGVNRLSMGVQSFRDEELARLTRIHSADRAVRAVSEARAAGFDNVSLDLMMWLPEQTVAEWLESVDRLVDIGPEHASMYLLEVYPNAPLRDTMARSRWSLAPDDDAADMYLSAFERMDRAGYDQYEISNAARPGRHSRHNLKYWSDGEWLGFGCGAHSTRDGVRWKNVAAVEEYMAAVGAQGVGLRVDRRGLSVEERLEEALFTGLRLAAGVDLLAVNWKYGTDVWARFGESLQPFVDQGLLIYDGTRLRLTRQGMLLAHEVMTVFIGCTVR